jgi:hypothetical protein
MEIMSLTLSITCYSFNFLVYWWQSVWLHSVQWKVTQNFKLSTLTQGLVYGKFDVESILNFRVTTDDQIEYLL